MSNLYWLRDAQMAKLHSFIPKSHGGPCVDNNRVPIGIISFNRSGLRWRDDPEAYGQQMSLYSRWNRWSENGLFAQMLMQLAGEGGETDMLMIPRPISRPTAQPPPRA